MANQNIKLIEKILDSWFIYLERCEKQYVGKMCLSEDKYFPNRTASLAINGFMHAELKGLSMLASSVIPQSTIEGVLSKKSDVPLIELYNFDGFNVPFWTDRKNKFPSYLDSKNIMPKMFYLHISSSNDLAINSNFYGNFKKSDLIIISDREDTYHAFTIEGGAYGIYAFHKRYGIGKKVVFREASEQKLGLVYRTLSNASNFNI